MDQGRELDAAEKQGISSNVRTAHPRDLDVVEWQWTVLFRCCFGLGMLGDDLAAGALLSADPGGWNDPKTDAPP